MGLSVIIITKNEARDLPRALASVSFAEEIIVLDSGSDDGTQKIASDWGAKVFETSDWPGFGPQKNRALESATQEWVLSLDADEWLEPELAGEIQKIISGALSDVEKDPDAYRFRRRSIFIDRLVRFGDWRRDRVTRLFRRGQARFSEDLVHEKLVVKGRVCDLTGILGHHPVISLEEAAGKKDSYNLVAAARLAAVGRGGSLLALYHSAFSLVRGLIFRLGLLDGRRGIQLAWLNAEGVWLKYRKAGELIETKAWLENRQTPWQKFLDYWSLVISDHGFLRSIYSNLWPLSGGMYRVNQPAPWTLRRYHRKFGIRTVINLRGRNDHLGWYRLESATCEKLGIRFLSFPVYSRGLIESDNFSEIKRLIESVELPALVHCKSGADRAGFFSVLYRHYRLGEPIELATSELGMKYGHFRQAKTGILDFFFQNYLSTRQYRESLLSWVGRVFDKTEFDASFKQTGLLTFLVEVILKRE